MKVHLTYDGKGYSKYYVLHVMCILYTSPDASFNFQIVVTQITLIDNGRSYENVVFMQNCASCTAGVPTVVKDRIRKINIWPHYEVIWWLS